jgi:D-alanyl-lipoteichoic acid acyltransferase DltB (MBOAT superfamily)
MDTASFQFVLFGLVVAVVSNAGQTSIWRSSVLFLSSLLFLGLLSFSPPTFYPMAGFLFVGYIGLKFIRYRWIGSLLLSIVIAVVAYVWLKQYTFLPKGIFLNFTYLTLGLSYILFRMLHLFIEAADEGQRFVPGFGAYLLYMINFTTFVSGPIQRYDQFARDQFAEVPISLRPLEVMRQLERITLGFFKIHVLALLLSMVQLDALAELSQPTQFPIKLSAAFKLAVAYPFFLYANFSGYIDIVIALARLMRVRLPENFDRPFSACSFIDFWNRWHITLSTWLKTYVYNPLLIAAMRAVSSSKTEPLLAVFCYFVTFSLIGVWHGRSSEFAVFGLLQGGGVAANKLWQLWLTHALGRKSYKQLANYGLYRSFSRGLTFTWFAFTLFWFWASWGQLYDILMSIGACIWIAVWLMVWIWATIGLEAWEWLRNAIFGLKAAGRPGVDNPYVRIVFVTALGLAAFIVTAVLTAPAPDIVYKAF